VIFKSANILLVLKNILESIVKKYPEGFWLVLLFNFAFMVGAYRISHWLLGTLWLALLAYITPKYIRYLKKRPD